MSAPQSLGLSPFGPASFLKAPVVAPDGDWTADAAFLGVPFDQATGFRPGARWGPRAARDMSVRFSAIAAPGKGGYFDLRTERERAVCSVVDCGDVDIQPLVWERDFDAVTAAVAAVLAKGAFPLVVGGDHAISYPVLRAFADRGPITVVQLDAHLDYRDDAAGVRYGHGNVLRRVRELAAVERVVTLGLRSARTRREDVAAHRADGNLIVPAWELRPLDRAALAGRLPRDRQVYVTFDIDVLDPAVAPGTGTPEVGGLDYETCRAILELVFAANRVVGFDLVEVNPMLDVAGITGLMAAQLLVDVLGLRFPG